MNPLLPWIRPEPLVAVLLWGGIFTAGKIGLAEIPFASFMFLRLVISAGLLLAIARPKEPLREIASSWRLLAVSGLFQVSFQLLLFLSLLHTAAANSAVLFATSPILLTLGLWVVRRSPPPTARIAGVVLGLAGVCLVVRPSGFDVTGGNVSGGLLAVASAGCWGWYAVAVRPLVPVMGSVRATGWSLAVAAAYTAPFSIGELPSHPWLTVSMGAWLALLYTAIIGATLAMTLWARSVHRLGPEQTMAYTYVESVSAVVVASLLLGERLGPIEILGGVLIFVALWLSR